MKELKELGDRLRKLKEENESRKKSIKKLKSDRALLTEKNRYLIEKLKEASVAYSNAGKSILDLVNTQVKPVKKKLEKFDSIYKRIYDYEKSVSEGLGKVEGFEDILNSLKTAVFNLEKGQIEFDSALKDLSNQTGKVGDTVLRLEGLKIDSKTFDGKINELGKTVSNLKDSLNTSLAELRNGFQKSIVSLREDVDKLSERKEKGMEKDITAVESELKGRIKEMEKGFNVAVRELGEGFGKLGERLARIESVKVGGKEVGEKLRSIERDMSGFRKEFHDSLLNMRKDVDRLSERKEERLGRGISEVEEELNKKIEDLNSNFGELNEMIVSIRSTKGDSESIDKRIKDLEGFLNASVVELRNGFQKSLVSLREDVDKLSERKEKGMEKDMGEVEEELSVKIKQVEKSLNTMKDNFDTVVSSVRREIKGGEGIKKDEINRVTREFFGIRAQIEERMKQLTEQFDQLDKFKDEFRKGFENRVAASEVSVKKLMDTLSKMENQLKVISEKSFVNENRVKEIDKIFKESVKSLENKIDSISKTVSSIKKESSKELDKLIEEAGG